MNRRKFLSSVAVASFASTAGCINNNSKEYEGNYGHPSANNINSQPLIGPEPSNSNSLIIGFEDPACPICKSFHDGAYQELKDKYIDSGELTFVYRGVDVVYNWGKMPLQIQESVYQEEGSKKSIELINEYYNRQDNISGENVQEKSKEILEYIGLSENYLSGLQQYDSEYNSDVKAYDESGVRGTPTFYLFKDKNYETEIVGSKNTSVYESVLDL